MTTQPVATLDGATLRRLRQLIQVVQTAPDRATPLASLVQLADDLPAAVVVTIDFAAAGDLGQPLVVLQTPRRAEPPRLFRPLSPREQEIVALLAAGLTNKEMAYRLGISLATVKDHVHHILSKTELPSRSAVVAAYLRPAYDDRPAATIHPMMDAPTGRPGAAQ